MENNQVDTEHMTTKEKVLIGVTATGLASLIFFGTRILIKKVKTKLKENYDNTHKTTDDLAPETPVQTPAHTKPHTGLPAGNAGPAFPLRFGAKGDQVRQLQLALIRRYGAGILPKSGADGSFGTELEAALMSKGYTLPLQEADYNKITQEKQPAVPAPLVAFDSAAVAKGLYAAISARDFDSSITLLKAIRDTSSYALVSEKLKQYYINGVRQTLVNAMLRTFTESSQNAKVQDVFRNMGLKYNGYQWSLSGFSGFTVSERVQTSKQAIAVTVKTGTVLTLPSNLPLGFFLYSVADWSVVSVDPYDDVRIYIKTSNLKPYQNAK